MPKDHSAPVSDAPPAVAGPLVSCLMPTRDRRPFVPLALGYFLRQDYADRELVILDDGDDPVADLIPDDPRIRYHRLDRPYRLGTKRNLACEEARGDVLVHWDDDDWMAPWRLRYQVEELLARKAELCGVDRLYFFSPETDRAWEYIYPAGGRPWLAGGTLCFTRDFWHRHPFHALQTGEDTHFVLSARGARLANLTDHRFYVALVHGGNTDVKRTEGDRWHRRDAEAVRALLGDDAATYRRFGPPAPAAPAAPGFRVVILSANAANLVPCVRSLLRHEPDLPASSILVVDDGAREAAEKHLPGITWIPGERPFVFARNANRGLAAARDADVVLLNDDARLETPRGLIRLADEVRRRPGLGVCSAGVRGIVGNPRQRAAGAAAFRAEPATLAFVCVYLTRTLIGRLGPLDERFVGYGFEDNDYCRRARDAGFGLGVWSGCIVDHGGALASSFRTRPDFAALYAHNRRLYDEKWTAAIPPAAPPAAPVTAPVASPERGGTAVLRGRPQFLAALRVKNEAERIAEVVESLLPLCERVLVFDDHSSDDTAEICRARGAAVKVLASPFEGLDEARDKNFLLAAAHDAAPEWVLWIDGDEVLEKNGPHRLRRRVARAGGHDVFALRIAYLWDDERRVRTDGIFGRFFRPSLFRLGGRPRSSLRFLPTANGGNFHCGNVPTGFAGAPGLAAVRLKHYGYLSREQRQLKYRFYNRIDPGNAAEDEYRHLAELPGARLAPGPPRFEAWTD